MMKNIAITIDEPTLRAVDRLVRSRDGRFTNRSAVLREAAKRLVAETEHEKELEREREIFRRHRRQLARDAAALVRAQARP